MRLYYIAMEHHCIPDMTQVVKKITLNSPPYHGGCWSCYVGYSTSCRSGEWWVLYWYSIIITIVHHSQGSLVPRLAPRNEACPWSLMYCTISEKGASMYIYDSMIGWLIFQYGRLIACGTFWTRSYTRPLYHPPVLILAAISIEGSGLRDCFQWLLSNVLSLMACLSWLLHKWKDVINLSSDM